LNAAPEYPLVTGPIASFPPTAISPLVDTATTMSEQWTQKAVMIDTTTGEYHVGFDLTVSPTAGSYACATRGIYSSADNTCTFELCHNPFDDTKATQGFFYSDRTKYCFANCIAQM